MRISVIVIVVLTFTAIVHGYDKKRARKFLQNMSHCSEKFYMKFSAPDARVLRCALRRDGEILDENGQIRKIEMLSLFVDIFDGYESMNAQVLFRECYRQAKVENGKISKTGAMEIIECILPVIAKAVQT